MAHNKPTPNAVDLPLQPDCPAQLRRGARYIRGRMSITQAHVNFIPGHHATELQPYRVARQDIRWAEHHHAPGQHTQLTLGLVNGQVFEFYLDSQTPWDESW